MALTLLGQLLKTIRSETDPATAGPKTKALLNAIFEAGGSIWNADEPYRTPKEAFDNYNVDDFCGLPLYDVRDLGVKIRDAELATINPIFNLFTENSSSR